VPTISVFLLRCVSRDDALCIRGGGQVFWARVQHLVQFFSNTLKNAVVDSETFLEGCEYVSEDLLFVEASAMDIILQIFARLFKRMKCTDFDSDLAIKLFLKTQEVRTRNPRTP
jgi:hypothetical protein